MVIVVTLSIDVKFERDAFQDVAVSGIDRQTLLAVDRGKVKRCVAKNGLQ